MLGLGWEDEPLALDLVGLPFGEVAPFPLEVDCVRSKMRSFFSALPVATQVGEVCWGKATDLTMWSWRRVWRHSPVWGSQILLDGVSKESDRQ